LRHWSSTRGFKRGQRKKRTTIAATTMIGITTATQSPAGLIRGDPFETVGGRRIAAAITISTLTAVKNRDWTTTAEASPATEDPAMLARKMPIIAAVPPCAGTTALIAVPLVRRPTRS
jgi:hypothetical protein